MEVEHREVALADATLADEAVLSNPFPFYDMIRERDPVHFDRTLNAWLVSRYGDVRQVLTDTDSFSMELGWSTNYAHGFVEESMEILKRDGGGFFPDVIMPDPPRHTRIRRLMEKAFAAHRVKSLEAGITDRVVRMIDRLPDAGEIDGMADLAHPLTIDILAEQLGIPDRDQERIERWTLALSAQVGRMQTREEMQRNAADICDLQNYIFAMIEERRKSPTSDLVSDLVHARNEDDEAVLDFDQVMRTNVAGVMYGCQFAARHMRDHGGGSIVNISSVLSLQPGFAISTYRASKSGVNNPTRSLAIDLGEYRIRVNAIAPGAVPTKMGSFADSSLPPDLAASWRRRSMSVGSRASRSSAAAARATSRMPRCSSPATVPPTSPARSSASMAAVRQAT